MTYPHASFAASNSSQGFQNYYGEIFSDQRMDRLYIIKGGPGTGKSHFMKAVSHRARLLGYDVEEFFCSSDPTSLDGIRLCRQDKPTIGLLDGTSPHVREPNLPGARDEMVNLGAFWDSSRLTKKRERIHQLADGKSAAYQNAYAYLRAAGEVEQVGASLMDACIQKEHLASLARRLLRNQPDGDHFEAIPALRSALGMTGYTTLHTYERTCSKEGGSLVILENYLLRGHGSIGAHLTRLLWELSREKRLRLFVSYDPVHPSVIDGLYYPDTGLCILLGHAEPEEGTPTRAISLRRYVTPEALRPLRGRLRHAASLSGKLVESATACLGDAAGYHFDLEAIYVDAMDFSAKEAFTEKFCEKLFD